MPSFLRSSKGDMYFPGGNSSIAFSRSVASFAVVLLRFIGFALGALLAMALSVICLYLVVSSPPLHLYYPVADPAGPSSIYVPGSGFSGFWFHLGFLQALPSIDNHDIYCYSSGCLSVLLAIMNTTLDTAADSASSIQADWIAGNISRYQLVDRFIDDLFMPSTTLENIFDRLHILVTTNKNGVAIEKASNLRELKELLLKTTYIPFVTGRDLWYTDDEGIHLDGGFSRTLHPKCDISLHVPYTLWDITQHTLNPTIDLDQAKSFWLTGQQYRHQLMAASQ